MDLFVSCINKYYTQNEILVDVHPGINYVDRNTTCFHFEEDGQIKADTFAN